MCPGPAEPLPVPGPQVTSRKYPRLKEVDDVLGGAAAWENVDSTAGRAGPRGRAGLAGPCRPLTALSRRAVPQVRAPPRLLHADPDALGRRAHDHLLQVLQPAVRAPLAGLRGAGIAIIAAPAINAALPASRRLCVVAVGRAGRGSGVRLQQGAGPGLRPRGPVMHTGQG